MNETRSSRDYVRAFAAFFGEWPRRAAWWGAAFTAPLNGLRVGNLISLGDALLVIAVITALLSRRVRHRSLLDSTHGPVLIGVCLITAGGLVGTLMAERPEQGVVEMTRFVLGTAGPVAAVALLAPRRDELRRLCALWLAGAVLSALWALTLGPTIIGRSSGLSAHPNHLGMVCVLGAGLSLGFTLVGGGLTRWIGLGSFLVLGAGLVSSGSRAALLGLSMAAPAVVLLSRRARVAVCLGAVAVVVGGAILVGVAHPPAENRLGRLFGDRSTTESDRLRLRHLANGAHRVRSNPVTGEGFRFAHESHNVYLQVLVAAGPLGLLGFVVVARSVLVSGSRGIGSGSAPVKGDGALLAGLTGGYAGYLMAAFFQDHLSERYLWLYLAAALALSRRLQLDGVSRPSTVPASGSESERSFTPAFVASSSAFGGDSPTRPLQ